MSAGATVAGLSTRLGSWREHRADDPRHDARTASWLGLALGVSFTVCFVTGLCSHLLQHRPGWFPWPTRPVWLFRLTQGLHVFTGIASIPLLLAKLWSVAHHLVEPPKLRPPSDLVARAALVPLVAGSLFLLVTGVLNIDYWYVFGFSFPAAHYAVAWITVGALIVHVGAQAATVRRELLPGPARPAGGGDLAGGRAPDHGRRRFLGFVAASSGTLLVTTVGETVSPFRRFALLAPRRPDVGPQGFPVNKSFAESRIEPAALDPARWRLRVTRQGSPVAELTLADLAALPQRTARLPVACVEGWSAERTWTGPAVVDVLARAGLPRGEIRGRAATVHSLERGGYASSDLTPDQVVDPLTLLALQVDGQALHRDHGFPLRLIAPARPGVLQTKWLGRIEVH